MFYFQILFLSLVLCAIQSNDSVEAARRKPRMVGVTPKEHYKFPYNVFIFHVDDHVKMNNACSGAILDDNHVITAAHCFLNVTKTSSYLWQDGFFYITTGTTNSLDVHDKIVMSLAHQVFIHKKYKDSLRNRDLLKIGDIAVIKLQTPLNLIKHTHLKPVKLLKNDKLSYAGKTAVVNGYGQYQGQINFSTGVWKGDSDGKLRTANATVISNSVCQSKWDRFTNKRSELSKISITKKHICVDIDQEDSKNPKGICNGDSGGPLIYSDRVLIGVTQSTSNDCNNVKAPSIFSRISEYEGFIEKARNYNNNVMKDSEIVTKTFPIEKNSLFLD